jgi:hypothetical protein
MGVTRGEIVRLYLKIGDMVATILKYYDMRSRLTAERRIFAEQRR